jgi:Icc protein
LITIAHVSDTHLDGGDRAHERTARVLDLLAQVASEIDVVLITGDIADHGLPPEYAEARELLAKVDLPVPVLKLPGNHDVRSPFASGLLDREPSDAEINELVTVGGYDFLLCDSSIPGQDDGRLSDQTIDWLEQALAGADRPALVCFHHPPVILHTPHIDRLRQFDEERLAAVVRRHPRVVGLLCGHAHMAAVSTFAGVPLCVGPGVVSTLRLPFEPSPAIDLDLPPGLAFHIVDDDGRLVTHFRVVT